MRITSPANPLVKRLRTLHEPRERSRQQLYLLEGPRLVREALAVGAPVVEALVSGRLDRLGDAASLRAGLAARAALHDVSDRVLDRVSDAATHQGVVAVVRLSAVDLPVLADRAHRLVVSCGIADPGNQGALVRLCLALGWDGVVAAGGADPWSPRAVRASGGAILRLAVAAAPDVGAALGELRARGYRLLAAVPRGGGAVEAHREAPRIALLLGGEGGGIPAPALERVDARVSIVLGGAVESLNVATAAAILLDRLTRRGA